MPSLGRERYPSSWTPWNMGIAGAGLESQMRLRRCVRVQQRKESYWTWKGSLKGGAGEERKFPFGFSSFLPCPQSTAIWLLSECPILSLSSWIFHFRQRALISHWDCFGSLLSQQLEMEQMKNCIKVKSSVPWETKGTLCSWKDSSYPTPHYRRPLSFTRRLGCSFIEILLRVERERLWGHLLWSCLRVRCLLVPIIGHKAGPQQKRGSERGLGLSHSRFLGVQTSWGIPPWWGVKDVISPCPHSQDHPGPEQEKPLLCTSSGCIPSHRQKSPYTHPLMGWTEVPPKICWNPNPQYLRLWPYLEIGLL